MSLFSSLQLASNALYAQSIGLQVIGNNIANVNTPGYSRAITNFTPAPTQRVGRLLLGLGVEVDSIKQRIDEHLNSRLRGATADRVGSEIQESAYAQLEGMLNELQDNDLSTSLNNFLGAISQVLNQPESVSVRNLAVLQGKTLAVDINRLSSRTHELRDDLNAQTADLAPDVNRLLQRVAELNVQIATTEGGGSVGSDAVGLRDQRNVALEELSQLIEIKTQEQSSGAINVFAGGDFLIFEGTFRQVEILHTQENGLNVAQLQVKETDAPLQAATGKLAGLVDARDNIIGKFLADLDGFAKTLAFEFNKVFSSGQGLSGYTQLTSEQAPSDANVALDHAGLAFTPVNGTFNVLVKNTQTGLTKTTQIKVDLNGLDDDDTTLNSLVAQLEAIDGVSASLDVRGRLVLTADAPNSQFAFGDDTSGVLAALGINTFFSGT
ncbi:MAG: flagellar hook-associated protein FlgK, partial [Planctomycetes bacterium]|nr:flagellar hook-associated protein FlgK [Planctomycetota bacterium]